MWVASLMCHCFEWVGLLFGVSINCIRIHTFSIVCHFLGSFMLLCGSIDAWDYRYFLWIFGIFSYPPAFLELYRAFSFVVWDYNLMKQIEIRV